MISTARSPPPSHEDRSVLRGADRGPVEDIEIALDQDGDQRILATVDAADDYRFEVQVTVPHDAVPGRARLFARAPGWDLSIEPELQGLGADLVIGEAAPAGSPSTTDAAAPSTDPKPDDQEPSEPTRSESGSRSTWILAIGVTVACAVAIGARFVLVRRRSAPSIPVDR